MGGANFNHSENDPFTNSEEIPVTSDMTLKAVWKIKTYKVVINNNSISSKYYSVTVGGQAISSGATVNWNSTIKLTYKSYYSGWAPDIVYGSIMQGNDQISGDADLNALDGNGKTIEFTIIDNGTDTVTVTISKY